MTTTKTTTKRAPIKNKNPSPVSQFSLPLMDANNYCCDIIYFKLFVVEIYFQHHKFIIFQHQKASSSTYCSLPLSVTCSFHKRKNLPYDI
jgi:hypothetical protein